MDLATLDLAVLAATQLRWTCHTLTAARRQAFTYTGRMEGWVT